MVKKPTNLISNRTVLKAFHKSLFAVLVLAVLLTACLPAQPSQDQVQSTVQSSVAQTMQAQNQVSTFVALTVQAGQPVGTETQQPGANDTPTPTPTETSLVTLTPILIESVTPAPVSGGGGYHYVPPAAWSCDPDIDKRPLDSNPPYAPGDHFLIKWTLLNTGTQTWPAGLDLTWFSVRSAGIAPTPMNPPQISTITGPIELPEVKPNHTYQVPTMEGIAPNLTGRWVLTWKLQGGWCFPYVIVNVK